MKKCLFVLTCALSLVLGSQTAEARFPEKRLNVVVPYGPAGSNGAMARMTAPFLAERLGVQVNVINKPGAGTQVGLDYFLRQPQDGYTILMTTIAPATSTLVAREQISEEMFKKLAYINGQGYNPYVLAVPNDSPYKTVNEVYSALKQKHGALSSCAVAGGGGHAGQYQMLDAYGLPHDSLRLVTYQSGNECMAAMMGHQVDFGILTSLIVSRMKDSVRVLAIMDPQRDPLWPGVPTINEALAEVNLSIDPLPGSLLGWAVSQEFKDKYPDRFAILAEAMKAVVTDPKTKEMLVKAGVDCNWMGPEETTKAVMRGHETVMKSKYGSM